MLRRPRLLEMLDDDAGASFTVLNAAVGYGKTTLVRSWCVERPEAVIWVTLDSADDDPVRLWTHLATAVERLGDGFGLRALSCLGIRGAPVEAAVDELMNGLVAYGRRVTIVLDDLHAIRGDASVRSLAHAIDRLPPNARLVVSTRSDPAIGVAWPAGLYLAALWLRDLQDPDGGVREFAGSARHVGDYLADEVLAALAPDIKDFLIRTSVLGRFTPGLCDVVPRREDSVAVLADLARSNMFLVALDARGEWYRYHHLFGEVLQLELGSEAARELRRRAAAWCSAHGLVEEAIEYAAAAGDAEMVADLLIERHLEFIWGGGLRQFLGWVRWLPAELLVQHPVLPTSAASAAVLLAAPEVEVERLLAVADRSRRERPGLWSPYLEAGVELVRSEAIERGNVDAAIGHARRAVDAARAGADLLSVAALGCLAQALFFAGELDETRRVAVQAVERPDAPADANAYVGSLGLLALVDAEHGRIESAEAWARQALGFARQHFQADLWVASLAHLGLALAFVATGRLDEAEREALRGVRLRRSPQPTVGYAHALLVLARVRVARSRLVRAARDLERAKRAIVGFPDPGRLPATAATVEQALLAARAAAGSRELVEEPSRAELAVLRGLAAGLSRREIGAQLYISLNTVKSHTRELYRKLGATSQTEAVARAEALGLLDPGQSPG